MTNPTPTDWRALCAELLAGADEYTGMNPYMRLDNAMKAARAALAQPEPQGPVLDCDEIEVPVWHRGDDFYVYKEGYTAGWAAGLNAAVDCWGRPKPPSLKQQALETLRVMRIEPCIIDGVNVNAELQAKYDTIRRALEALPND